MSSGDESDNVDLTDGETSDSDWSDTGEFICRCEVNYHSIRSTCSRPWRRRNLLHGSISSRYRSLHLPIPEDTINVGWLAFHPCPCASIHTYVPVYFAGMFILERAILEADEETYVDQVRTRYNFPRGQHPQYQ
jgi:hypothetical protein